MNNVTAMIATNIPSVTGLLACTAAAGLVAVAWAN
jgi:hypothetical protein